MSTCPDAIEEPDGSAHRCRLPPDHPGWHLDWYRLVDEGELHLRVEIRWDRRSVARDDL